MERRLAAILVADVVGYSKLMGEDETGTLSALKAHRKNLFYPETKSRGGRIVKLMGDGVLVEFGSVVDAVECALSIQRVLAEDDGSIKLRIGVNLGDVVIDGDDIYGDGVNLAARLEALAEPGGICISSIVHESLGNRINVDFSDCGKHEVKNIDRPVWIWKWPPTEPDLAPKTLALPDKPSIAVLPFKNMSSDQQQDFFSEGLSEDIITQLSRFRTLFIVARNSSFSFKGENPNIKQVGQKLGAQYIVEGSVRRAGNRIRVTVQLIEAGTGSHLWAERYDRDLEDYFTVQDEVTQSIVAVLPGRVQADVAERASSKPTDNMKAYELLLKGKSLRDGLNAEDTDKARNLYKKALELDPRYARVYMYLADTYVVDSWLGLADSNAPTMALEIARKGAALDNNDVYIQDQLGYAYLCAGLWEDANAQFERTLSQIVNEAESMAWCGYGFLLLGHHEKAREVVLEAMRLDPLHPPALDWIYGQICFFTKQYDAGIQALIGEALLNSLAHAFLAASYAHSGRVKEAHSALKSFIKQRHRELNSRGIAVESDTFASLAKDYQKMWRREIDWEHLADGLLKAGLPE